jgi:hypothetical protein
MADIRTTIKKTVWGNKRVHYGTATKLNATTSGTIDTELPQSVVETFIMSSCLKFTESAGTVTATFADPTESRVVGWMAIGY